MDCKIVDIFMGDENCLNLFIVIDYFFFESFEVLLDLLFLLLKDFIYCGIFSDSNQIVYDKRKPVFLDSSGNDQVPNVALKCMSVE